MKPNTKRKLFLIIYLSCIGVLLNLFWMSSSIQEDLEYTLLSRIQRGVPQQDRSQKSHIVILSVDQPTQAWRDLYGRLSPRLYAIRYLKRAHTKAVIYDIDWKDEFPKSISRIGQSLQGTHEFINGFTTSEISNYFSSWNEYSKQIQDAFLTNSVIIKGFPNHSKLASLQLGVEMPDRVLLQTPLRFYAPLIESDRVGIVRTMPPFAKYGGHYFPSVAIGTLLNGRKHLTLSSEGVLKWDKGHLRIGRDQSPLINWYGNVEKPPKEKGIKQIYPRFSYWDIIQSELVLECRENPKYKFCNYVNSRNNKQFLSPKIFEGQYVLIGVTESGSGDIHSSPYGGEYHGVNILANVIDNALHDDFIIPAPFWLNLICFLFMGIVELAAMKRHDQILLGIMQTILIISIYAGIVILAYREWNLWLNFLYPSEGIIFTFMAVFFYRYTKLKSKHNDPESGLLQSINA